MRLLVDGDGLGDDRRLNMLLKVWDVVLRELDLNYSLFMMVTEDQEDLIKGLVLLLVLDVLIL